VQPSVHVPDRVWYAPPAVRHLVPRSAPGAGTAGAGVSGEAAFAVTAMACPLAAACNTTIKHSHVSFQQGSATGRTVYSFLGDMHLAHLGVLSILPVCPS